MPFNLSLLSVLKQVLLSFLLSFFSHYTTHVKALPLSSAANFSLDNIFNHAYTHTAIRTEHLYIKCTLKYILYVSLFLIGYHITVTAVLGAAVLAI